MSCIGEAVRRNIGKTDPEEACDFAEGFIKEAMLSDKNLSEILDSYSKGNETKKMNVNVHFMAAVLTIIDEARNRKGTDCHGLCPRNDGITDCHGLCPRNDGITDCHGLCPRNDGEKGEKNDV